MSHYWLPVAFGVRLLKSVSDSSFALQITKICSSTAVIFI